MPLPINTLFEGVEGLSPDFLAKAENIIEAAVKDRTLTVVTEAENVLKEAHATEITALNEAHEVALNEAEANLMETFVPVLNTFLENTVMEWANANAETIDSKLKLEAAESFLTGLGNLFTEANVEVPEKQSIVEGYETKITELTTKLDEAQVKLNESETEGKLAERNKLVENAVEGMTDTQADRVRALTEGDDFSDLTKFGARVSAYRELVEAQDKPGEKEPEKDGEKKPEKDGEKKPIKEGAENPEQLDEGVDPIVAATMRIL